MSYSFRYYSLVFFYKKYHFLRRVLKTDIRLTSCRWWCHNWRIRPISRSTFIYIYIICIVFHTILSLCISNPLFLFLALMSTTNPLGFYLYSFITRRSHDRGHWSLFICCAIRRLWQPKVHVPSDCGVIRYYLLYCHIVLSSRMRSTSSHQPSESRLGPSDLLTARP